MNRLASRDFCLLLTDYDASESVHVVLFALIKEEPRQHVNPADRKPSSHTQEIGGSGACIGLPVSLVPVVRSGFEGALQILGPNDPVKWYLHVVNPTVVRHPRPRRHVAVGGVLNARQDAILRPLPQEAALEIQIKHAEAAASLERSDETFLQPGYGDRPVHVPREAQSRVPLIDGLEEQDAAAFEVCQSRCGEIRVSKERCL